MDGQGSGRVYIGNLPADYTEKDVQKEFESFGSIVKIDLKKAANGNGYCFVEFEDPRDARDAIAQMHGRPPARDKDAPPLRVELPNSRRDGRGGRPATGVKRGNYIVEIAGLPPSGSWQDLKDHFRACGEVGYADVWGGGDPDAPRFGEVSFFSRRDMLEAIERLDGSTFCSHQSEKSRISVREKRTNGLAEDNDEYDHRRGGYSSNDGGYYSRTGGDRRYGGGSHGGYGGGASHGGYGGGGGSQGGYGGGYSRGGYRSPSPRGGQDRGGYDDVYHSDRGGYGRGRSRSRERRPPSSYGGGGYPPAPPPARHRGYDAPPRRYEEKGRS